MPCRRWVVKGGGTSVLALAVLLCLPGRAFASTTASIAISGAEQPGDANTITVAFNGFTETVGYGQFSTPASLASALAGMFSRDYLQSGLCASVASAGGSTVNFKLQSGAAFGALQVTGSTASFQLQGSGFANQGTVADTGTVTLTVSNGSGTLFSQTANYGAGATPSSVAQALQGSNSSVTVFATGDSLYIEALEVGANTDYSYSVTSSWNSSLFAQPSFQGSPASGSLGGGTGEEGVQPIYSYCLGTSNTYCSSTGPGYDAVGNVVNYSDSVMGAWTMVKVNGLLNGYDNLNRLVASQNTGVTGTSAQYAGDYGCWSYDDFGNRTTESMSTTPCGSNPPLLSWASYTTTNTNRMDSTSQNTSQMNYYDAAGDLTNDGINQYLYDAEGRICAVASTPAPGYTTMTGYVYDADGNRVAKGAITTWSCDPSVNGLGAAGSETDYVLGPSGQPETELAEQSGSMQWQRSYVYAAGALISTLNPVPNPGYSSDPTEPPAFPFPFYRFTDWLGTLRVTMATATPPSGTCTSLPFGDQLACQGTLPDSHYFTGKERDSESGNDYFGARYYASNAGRFLSPDFNGDPEPVPYADFGNPQTLNLYSYVQNNPLTKRDFDGHASWQPCPDGSGDQCWTGDYNGEYNNGLFWNSQSNEWQQNDPNSSPDSPAGEFFTGLTRSMIANTGSDFGFGVRQMASGLANDFFTLGAKSALALIPPVKFLHSKDLLEQNSNIDSVRKMSTQQIIDSLKPGQPDSLKAKADGTIMDGNTRLRVLEERGVDINSLPRELYSSETVAPWEEPGGGEGPIIP